MPDLILDSLEIQNFRGLKELRIERLGRVNLIVGKNNVGKTSILESLRVFATPGSADILLEILESRDQFNPNSSIWFDRNKVHFLPYQRLFYMEGRKSFQTSPPTIIKIGKAGLSEGLLSILLDEGPKDAGPFLDLGFHIRFESAAGGKVALPMWVYEQNELHGFRAKARELGMQDSRTLIPSTYLGANGLEGTQTVLLWDRIVLTPREGEVIEAICLIAEDVERLVLKPIDNGSSVRVPFVKLKGVDVPVPLRSLGDGMNRVFGIALALVNSKDGLFLIDEVENGLHYSVQPDIWRLIFKTAAKLNVQVFATTHSLDCVRAFDLAARESEEEGVLIRLAQKGGRTFVGEFDEHDLKIAVEGQIEVR